MTPQITNQQAKVLAAIYHLLLQKAAERRARLSREAIDEAATEAHQTADESKTKNAPG